MHLVSYGNLGFQFGMHPIVEKWVFKQRYITSYATILDRDRIYPNTHLCRIIFAGYICGCGCCCHFSSVLMLHHDNMSV